MDTARRTPAPRMVDRICANRSCRKQFQARAADVKRGWGRFCCKSCKAIAQEARTGQYANYINRPMHDHDEPLFTGAHLFSNEEHDCNKD